jgi:TatD DNase family protein
VATRIEYRHPANLVAGEERAPARKTESGWRRQPLTDETAANFAAVFRVMTSFIDSHAHLADAAFEPDCNEVIARARQTGVLGIVCIGESLEAADRAYGIAAAHPDFVRFTVGIHPHDADAFDPLRDLPAIEALVARGAVAIGECGLDYHYDHSPRDRQRRAFAAQLALANDVGKPVVVHTRAADADSAAMVAEAGAAGIVGVLHCFTGDASLAETALTAGWYLSFSGIITFKKWKDDALLRLVPSDRLLVESDSPYLAPVPHRGGRNEPAWASFTVARLAAARGADPSTIGRETAENARRFFAWPAES